MIETTTTVPLRPLSLAFDAAAETLDASMDGKDQNTVLVAAKCLGLLMGYDRRWSRAPYRIDAVECVMTSDLYNPESGRKSRSFINAGKIDVRATDMQTGQKVILDHKTSSQDIAPDAVYWQQLAIEGQVSHYMLLEWLNANKLDYGVWDVLRKPGIAPKTLAKKDIVAVKETSRYFDLTMDDTELEKFAVDDRETPLMYAARLAHDCSADRPDWYFQRKTVPRLDAEIREYGIELWGHGQDILASRQSGRHPRNSGACFTYNSPCKFLGVCSGHDSIASEKWSVKPWVHNELPILQGATEHRGSDVLTNSRVRTFQTCRQKHYFQYELGVEKVDEEEREALFFGTLMHTALEQYFLAIQEAQRKGTA
jgi:hypothetical protein